MNDSGHMIADTAARIFADLADPQTIIHAKDGKWREPLWRALNVARGAYWSELGNTPGHVNHFSKAAIVELCSRHGEVIETRSPFPWTMVLVRV